MHDHRVQDRVVNAALEVVALVIMIEIVVDSCFIR